jgi:hypothetical protein
VFKDIWTNVWWGLPDAAIKIYLSLCPECVSTTILLVGESLNPLKMMISNTIGVRAQMYLIDSRRRPSLGYRWISIMFILIKILKRKTQMSIAKILMSSGQ